MQPDVQQMTRHQMKFTGTGSEYFKIWIVNILLSMVTFYIYSAWAKVRTKRYFHGNTILDGSAFEYHAKPLQILLGRVIAMVLMIAFLIFSNTSLMASVISGGLVALAVPWVLWNFLNSVIYSAFSVSSDEKIIAVAVLIIVSAYVMAIPWWHRRVLEYFANHYVYGQSKFNCTLDNKIFYKFYVLAIALGVLLYGLAAALLFSDEILLYGAGMFEGASASDADASEDRSFLSSAIVGIGVWLQVIGVGLIFMVSTILKGYLLVRTREAVYRNAVLDNRVRLESTVALRDYVGVSITNYLMIFFSFGIAIPWARVHMAKFMIENTNIYSSEPLDHFVNAELEKANALGDELGEAFDIDAGLAI